LKKIVYHKFFKYLNGKKKRNPGIDMNEFKIPPISTLAGSTISNYFRILSQGRVLPKYYLKIALTTLIVIIATPFHLWERIIFSARLKKFEFRKPPLFILGHWRSGTTHLHNMLARDPGTGFISTYQALFPNNLSSKWLFKTFMKINMPEKRPTDNIRLNVNYPQEDEFAFSNCQPNAYYNFFYFPELYKEYFDKAVLHKNLSIKDTERWYNSYDKLLKKAMINSGSERLVVKNPVNTARIDKILKLYPDARFIFIYRNPVTVFLSTRHFFHNLFPTLWLHPVNNKFIDEMIFEIYERLMELYFELKSLIPAGNLVELKFEEFEKQQLNEMENIYDQLLNEDFSIVRPYFQEYFKSQKDYTKNKYKADKKIVEKIMTRWGKYIEMFGYQLPDDLEIINREY